MNFLKYYYLELLSTTAFKIHNDLEILESLKIARMMTPYAEDLEKAEIYCDSVVMFSTNKGGCGTGFFIKNRNKIYLITAKHVVRDMIAQELPITIKNHLFKVDISLRQEDIELLNKKTPDIFHTEATSPLKAILKERLFQRFLTKIPHIDTLTEKEILSFKNQKIYYLNKKTGIPSYGQPYVFSSGFPASKNKTPNTTPKGYCLQMFLPNKSKGLKKLETKQQDPNSLIFELNSHFCLLKRGETITEKTEFKKFAQVHKEGMSGSPVFYIQYNTVKLLGIIIGSFEKNRQFVEVLPLHHIAKLLPFKAS